MQLPYFSEEKALTIISQHVSLLCQVSWAVDMHDIRKPFTDNDRSKRTIVEVDGAFRLQVGPMEESAARALENLVEMGWVQLEEVRAYPEEEEREKLRKQGYPESAVQKTSEIGEAMVPYQPEGCYYVKNDGSREDIGDHSVGIKFELTEEGKKVSQTLDPVSDVVREMFLEETSVE